MESISFHTNHSAPLFIGQNYVYLPETNSTNLRLKTLSGTEKLPEGTVISTGYQTEGRGQAGSIWESNRDQNIMLSVLLYPGFLNAANQFLLSKAMALAAKDFISNFLLDKPVKIKWPNDIFVSGQKICGILIENGLKGEKIDYAIIGIGINVNEIFNDKRRTSLKEVSGLEFDLRNIEKVLFSNIEARYLQLKSSEPFLSVDYLESLFGFREKMHFIDKIKNADFEGVINGVGKDGRLIIETDGGLRLFNMKEVGFSVIS